MIQTLARKRMHLAALSALAGLVVALFAIAGTQAQVANKIIFDDSDAVVKAGTDVQVLLVAGTSTAAFADATGVAVNRWHVSGGGDLVFLDTAGTITPATGTVATAVTIVTTGAPDGEYTVTATVGTGATAQNFTATLRVGEPGEAIGTAALTFNKRYTATGGTFTCGAAPAPVDPASPTADETAQKASEATDTDTATAGASATSGICMVLNVENSLGNKPLDSSVTRITVITPGASADDSSAQDTQVFEGATALATTPFRIQKATSGTVDVYAIVFGARGAVATSNTVTLKFSGGPDAITAGDEVGSLLAPAAAGAANGGAAYIEVMATDKAGATTSAAGGAGATDNLTLDQADIGVKITDADGENVTTKFAISYAVRAAADDTTTTNVDESKISRNALAVVVGPGAAPGVAGGAYTVEVTLRIGSKNTAESTLNVVGPLANIEVTADKTSVVVGDIVVVTAKLTDANGLPVADGKAPAAAIPETSDGAGDGVDAMPNTSDDVVFTSAGALKLVGFGADANGQVRQEVKNGEASATFVVTQGSGAATVLVNVQTPRKTGTVTISTEDAAMADTGPSLSDFSRLSGLASYSGPDAQASELMELLAGRATAIWLSSGDGWVLYSSVDGSMVPGSMNFTATAGDVIYISN